MTVIQLISELNKYPMDAQVYLKTLEFNEGFASEIKYCPEQKIIIIME